MVLVIVLSATCLIAAVVVSYQLAFWMGLAALLGTMQVGRSLRHLEELDETLDGPKEPKRK